MIGFGESNQEFGRLSPGILSCEELMITDDDDSRWNSLIIRLKTETGMKYKIQFDDYIMHMTRNESYASVDEQEKRRGMWLLIFEKSHFLDLCDSFIINEKMLDCPGKINHYGVYTWDYIIDVLTSNEPIITQE